MDKQYVLDGEYEGISLEQIREARRLVADKWGKLGLLDGLQKENITSLYESQPFHMISYTDGRIRNKEEYEWTLELFREYSDDEVRHQEKLIVLRDLIHNYSKENNLGPSEPETEEGKQEVLDFKNKKGLI